MFPCICLLTWGCSRKGFAASCGRKGKDRADVLLYLAMQDALKEAEARKAASQNIKEGKEAPSLC